MDQMNVCYFIVTNGQGLMQVKTIDCRHISGNVLISPVRSGTTGFWRYACFKNMPFYFRVSHKGLRGRGGGTLYLVSGILR